MTALQLLKAPLEWQIFCVPGSSNWLQIAFSLVIQQVDDGSLLSGRRRYRTLVGDFAAMRGNGTRTAYSTAERRMWQL